MTMINGYKQEVQNANNHALTCNDLMANCSLHQAFYLSIQPEVQLSPSDRAMRLVSSSLANYHAKVQKLLIRQVLTKPMV